MYSTKLFEAKILTVKPNASCLLNSLLCHTHLEQLRYEMNGQVFTTHFVSKAAPFSNIVAMKL